MGKSVSFCKGKGSLAHNNREFSTPNVDQSRTHLNIVYKHEPLEVAYDKIFGEELARYNAAQKRADRKIPDYMEHIRTSKNGEKLFYENVVQVGTMYSCPVGTAEGEVAAKILDEYMRGFERRNPNIHVFNAVLHMDEATPHLHIDWIPVARDYKNGLQIRNSLDKALKQQGIDGRGGKKDNSTQRWQAQERGEVIAVMERHGWEYEASLDTDRGNLTVDQYKAMVEEVDHRVNALPDQIEKKPVPLSKDKVVVAASELEALEQRAKLMETRDTVTTNLREYRAEKQTEVETYVADRMKEATEEVAQMKQDQQLAWAEIDAEKEKLRRRSWRLDFEENQIATNKDKLREYDILKGRVNGLESAYNQLLREKSEAVKEGVERATQPLRAQIQAKDNEIQGLKSTVSRLEKRLSNVAQTAAALISAIKFVAEKFAGKVAGAILSAAARKSESWMKEDGLPEYANQEPMLVSGIGKELKLELQYKMKGPEGKGVYTAYGDLLANVDSYQDAIERFPGCAISREKDRSNVLE